MSESEIHFINYPRNFILGTKQKTNNEIYTSFINDRQSNKINLNKL